MSFVPNGNGPFYDFSENYNSVVSLYKATWNLPDQATDELTLLATKRDRFVHAWGIVKTKKFYPSDERELLDARQEYESGDPTKPSDTSIRIFITRYIRNNPLVTNKQKVDMGIVIPDEIKTITTDTNAKVTGIEMKGAVSVVRHLSHTITIDYAGTKSKKKPKGAKEVQIFIGYGDALGKNPPDIKTFAYDGVVTAGKYTKSFDAAQEGLRAYYYVRIVVKGRKPVYGTPSVIWSAVIA